MSKYNVGEMVKLRNDLEVGKCYGAIKFLTGMKELQNKPIRINHIAPYDNTYIVGIDNLWISDEMIEGLWGGCKALEYEPYEPKPNKLKLIDVLNKIANGELKEGTKVICNNSTFEYRKLHKDSGRNTLDLYSNNNTSLINATYLTPVLSFEVELIEPEHIFKDTKMIEDTQIPELDISELEIEGVDDLAFAFENMCDQLNKVIRKTNEQTKTLMRLKKQLDY